MTENEKDTKPQEAPLIEEKKETPSEEPKGEFVSEFAAEFDEELNKTQGSPQEDAPAQPPVHAKSLAELAMEQEKKAQSSQKYNAFMEKIQAIFDKSFGKFKKIEFKIANKVFSLLTIIKQALLLIILLSVAVGGVQYYNYFMKIFDTSILKHQYEDEEAIADDVEQEEESKDLGPIFEVTNIIVNYQDITQPKKMKLLKLSLGLELENIKVKSEIELKKDQLKHLLILYLSNYPYDEIRSKDGQKKLKKILVSKINGFLKTGSIKRIFFTEFVFS